MDLCRRRHASHWTPARCVRELLVPLLIVAALTFFLLGAEWTDGSPPPGLPLPPDITAFDPAGEQARPSPFSFDLAATPHADWMAAAPDHWPLTRMALPGTHDTLTFDVRSDIYRCQNHDLAAQLQSGVRYLDVRARVQMQVPPLGREPAAAAAAAADDDDDVWPLGIYHGSMYTGYELAAVLTTVFSFLDAHPSEAVVLRLKEEAMPIKGAVDDPPGRRPQRTAAEQAADDAAWNASRGPDALPSRFEESLRRYRRDDPRTAPGFADHVYRFPLPANATDADGWPLPGGPAPTRVPTMGDLRGKVLLLQEFPYFPYQPRTPETTTHWGIPWALSSDLLQVEDYFIVENLAHLDDKWDAVRTNLEAAMEEARAHAAVDHLFLSHLSASIGVKPIDAAAGPPDRSVVGINDRTGFWLEAGHDNSSSSAGPVGIVIADFPGQRLVDAVLQRNHFLREAVDA